MTLEENTKLAFNGVMKIHPNSVIVPAFEREGFWEYDADKKVWKNNGMEFAESICKIIKIN